MLDTRDDHNRIAPATAIEAATNVAPPTRKAETDGYPAIQIGFGEIEGRKVTKPRAGQFDKAGVTPRRHVAELRTGAIEDYEVGQELSAEMFTAGDVVDITGTSKGKGYAGVMKRHGFGGVNATHRPHH